MPILQKILGKGDKAEGSTQTETVTSPTAGTSSTSATFDNKKFNARKETVEGEDYYGIKIFRYASNPSHVARLYCVCVF